MKHIFNSLEKSILFNSKFYSLHAGFLFDPKPVKLGKKCTKLAVYNTYEKSIIWIVSNENVEKFESKINKENCKINGEKL